MPRHVNDVLYALDEQWSSSRADVEQAFQPEDPVAVSMEQHGQPDAEHLPVEWAVEDETAGCNAIAHGMHGRWSRRVTINHRRDLAERSVAMRLLRQQRGEIDAAEAGIDDTRGGID